ncbi:hypothetical protein E4K67_29065 [Desulfosporosinus fructosivorans]|uniref:Uncharacterized protein n=1 Tax=Desulfosporosinus fructosivorans TaxID=2018669 RepID=A0A4Z0QZH3_9FIRM|nr:hypothetical protein [Desulfosporosinus fructosivorans]TGE34746.1 hypothetical protein E4K67_29065 [Desulfosporosinus fructosivorans]
MKKIRVGVGETTDEINQKQFQWTRRRQEALDKIEAAARNARTCCLFSQQIARTERSRSGARVGRHPYGGGQCFGSGNSFRGTCVHQPFTLADRTQETYSIATRVIRREVV